MKLKADRAAVPYSYLIDNLKVLLIFLVVFNHIIAFNLVKVDIALFDNGRQPDNFRSGTDDGHEFEFVHIAPLF